MTYITMMNNFMSKNVGQFFIKIKKSRFSVVRLSSAAAKGNKALSKQSDDILRPVCPGVRNTSCYRTLRRQNHYALFQGQQVNSDLFMEKKFLAG